jgi:cytochrome b6-f complex iron-sulfur subunit
MSRPRHKPPSPPAAPSAAGADRAAPPATAAPAPPAADAPGPPGTAGQPRRRFVVRLWSLLGVAALGELAWVTASFLRPRGRDADASTLFVAGPADRFAPGSVTAFPAGRFYLVRLADGGFLALHRECTHLGCTVPWDAARARFACPCHASAFDITGQVLSAPAPRPLDYHPVRVENGVVRVDTRQRLRRTAFDASQVTVG